MDRILIVDSAVQNTDLMSECLSGADYETMTAESGLNAMAKIEAFKPDLVIIEAELQDMSGFDVCKKIKSNPATLYILVLIISQSSSTDSRMRAVLVGADDFMEKTFDSFILISKVKSLLRLKYLSEQLKQKYIELEEKNSILDFQLKMSKSVQRSMLPKINFTFNHVHFYSKYLPAMDIGGDFYDVIQIDENRVSVVIGDVSGHGIAAALLTSMLNIMIRNLVPKYSSPDQLLFYLNNEFYKIFEHGGNEMYACVFYAVIDTKEETIYYSNAGQQLPIYVDAMQNKAYELDSSGLPIGLIKNSQYEFKTMSYNPWDMLMFHTDGLADVFYKEDPDEFSARIKETLLEHIALQNPMDVVNIVLSSFYNYDATDNEKMEMDDVSIILCKM